MPGAYYNFYVSGTSVPAVVYQDAALTLPYPSGQLGAAGSSPIFSVVQGDGTGAFTPIFLNPQTIYRVQLYSSTWQLIEDVDPFIPSMMTTGNGPIQIDAQGEVTINAPIGGGTGITLAVTARSGGQALQLVSAAVGSAALIVNNSVLIGQQTASFVATNKPGAANGTPQKWWPVQADGTLFYIPLFN